MSRPRLHVSIPDTDIFNASVEVNGQPVYLTGLEVILRPKEFPQVVASFVPETLVIDLDARCLRLNGAQLPEEVGRAFLAQLKQLYADE